MKKLSYANIVQANNSSKSLHNLIVNNTKKEDCGLWIAAKNRSVELEKNLLSEYGHSVFQLKRENKSEIRNLKDKLKRLSYFSQHPILFFEIKFHYKRTTNL